MRLEPAPQAAGSLRAVSVAGVDLRRELRALHRRRPAPSAPARRLWGWLEALAAP